MNHMKFILWLLILLGAVMLLFSCNQVKETEVAVVEATEIYQTNTPLPPVPTEVPPTNTPVPPTDTPIPPIDTPTSTPLLPTETPTPEPTKDLPEVPVTKWEDLVGTWTVDKLRNFTTKYKADGITQVIDKGGQVFETDLCSFEGDVLSCSSDYCSKVDADTGKVITFTCIGKYRVFITKDGDIPVRLRYELIEDLNTTRAGMLTQWTWVWVEE
jgi:hypothetical protein